MQKFLFLLISLAFSVVSFSQNKTGTGNVSDNSGKLIPNAIVNISPASDTSVVFEYVCDKNGNYTFDISSNDAAFIVNILPSTQSLQFVFAEQYITLVNGNNGIFFHKVETTNTNGIQFTVVDTLGNPVAGAKVQLYDSKRKWRVDSCSVAKPFYTDINGQVEINSLLPIEYWFNVRKDYMTNRFTVKNTGGTIDTASITNITDTIRDLSQKEFYMCGLCDNKTWITDSMVIFGITQSYDADSKLLSDGTWYDSNGNHGFWWFNPDETKMTYDYDSSSANGGGSTVEATLIELTDSNFSGDMTMLGLPVTYFMSVRYDTINFNLSAQDTIIYLDSSGVANITADDLMINSNFCFTCNLTLSQSFFDINDLGNVDVSVAIEDRCGNSDSSTFTITIANVPSLGINEVRKTDFQLYPNPGNDYVVILSRDRISRIDILDNRGAVAKQIPVKNNRYDFNTSELNPGIYFVRIYTTNGVGTKKLLVE